MPTAATRSYRCSRCRMVGHNSRRCPNTNQSVTFGLPRRARNAQNRRRAAVAPVINLFASPPVPTDEDRAIVSERTFGVEIEFVGVSRDAIAVALRNAGINCEVQGYNHRSSDTLWKITTDGSVFDTNGDGEVVSPILRGAEGLAQVRRVAEAMTQAGAHVNRTCGLHVHVGADGLSCSEREHVARRYANFEAEIDRLMPTSRRVGNNRYCQSMREVFDFRDGVATTARGYLYDDRYFKVNLCAYLRHGTIEFRHHGGTTNAEKICNWIKFCVNFVEQSRQTNNSNSSGRSSRRGNGRGEATYQRLVGWLETASPSRATTGAIAAGINVAPASVAVLVSHLRTRYGYRIRRVRVRGYGYNYYRLLSHGSLGREVVAAPVVYSVPNDSPFRGLDAAATAWFSNRVSRLTSAGAGRLEDTNN